MSPRAERIGGSVRSTSGAAAAARPSATIRARSEAVRPPTRRWTPLVVLLLGALVTQVRGARSSPAVRRGMERVIGAALVAVGFCVALGKS